MKFTDEQLKKAKEFILDLQRDERKIEIIEDMLNRKLNNKEIERIKSRFFIVLPYQCPVCEKKFNSGKGLHNHLRKYLVDYDLTNYVECKIWNLFIDLCNIKVYCQDCKISLRAYRDNKTFGKKIHVVSKYCNKCVKKLPDVIEKRRQTCLEVYGYDNPMKVPEIKERQKQTCIQRFGVNTPSKNSFVKRKIVVGFNKKSIYKGIPYRCSYEKDFLILCEKLHLLSFINIPESFKYKSYDGKIRDYIPDFKLFTDFIIEIKATHWINENTYLKQKAVEDAGYTYVMILDKDYSEFFDILENVYKYDVKNKCFYPNTWQKQVYEHLFIEKVA